MLRETKCRIIRPMQQCYNIGKRTVQSTFEISYICETRGMYCGNNFFQNMATNFLLLQISNISDKNLEKTKQNVCNQCIKELKSPSH